MHGRVQGVFYRDWMIAAATRSGLTGWVRNRVDGTVEAHVEGAPDIVDAFITQAYDGPPAADVANIDISEAAVEGHRRFERRATA
jgi:acylphosphatase